QHKLHWLAEQALSWSGMPVVTVGPTVFLEGFFLQLAAPGVQASDELALPMRRSAAWAGCRRPRDWRSEFDRARGTRDRRCECSNSPAAKSTRLANRPQEVYTADLMAPRNRRT